MFTHRPQKSPRISGRVRKRPGFRCEAEVVEGLEDFARQELQSRFADKVTFGPRDDEVLFPGSVSFHYTGHLGALFNLHTVGAVYLLQHFPVPRPRALLGHEHFRSLLRQTAQVRNLHPRGTFHTIHLAAAGSHSSVMTRLKSELALSTGLELDDSAGDLLIRIRRPADGSDGWEALVRLTPRPLSARSWRKCNFEGALNASVAHVMTLLTIPKPSDVFVNLACGSGSILIERLTSGAAQWAIGCDNNHAALMCATANIGASDFSDKVQLQMNDMRALPFAGQTVDALCADLPFGQRIGSHQDNESLYPECLREAARVAKPRTRFAILTHEISLMEAALSHADGWTTEKVIRITLRGLHPRIFLLRKVNA